MGQNTNFTEYTLKTLALLARNIKEDIANIDGDEEGDDGLSQYQTLLPGIHETYVKASRGEDVTSILLELADDLPGMVGRTLRLVATRDFRDFLLTAISGSTISSEDRIIMEMGPEIPQEVEITLSDTSIDFGGRHALVHFSLGRLAPANKRVADELEEAWRRGKALSDRDANTHLAGLTSELIALATAASDIHPNPELDTSYPQ